MKLHRLRQPFVLCLFKSDCMRKPLSRPQAVCLVLLWVSLCAIVLTSAKIDGPLVLSLAISALLVAIPVWKSFKR